MTLLTEYRVEWILLRLGWRRDGDLDIKHLNPGGIGFNTEHFHTIENLNKKKIKGKEKRIYLTSSCISLIVE